MKRQLLAVLALSSICASAEAQGFSAWSVFSNNPDLTVTSAAAYPPTSFGMQAVVNDTQVLLVRDNTPSAESRYRARFYFNPNGYTIADGVRQPILMTQRDSDSARSVTLHFRRVGGGIASFLARVQEDTGALRNFPLGQYPTDTWHMIEFDWQRETTAGATDGRFEVWVDGTQRGLATNIDNFSTTGVDFARMGVMSPVGGTGTVFFDEFESRRQTYIGPIAP